MALSRCLSKSLLSVSRDLAQPSRSSAGSPAPSRAERQYAADLLAVYAFGTAVVSILVQQVAEAFFRLEAGTLQVTAAVTTKLVGIVNYGTASVQGGTIRVEKGSAAGEVYGVQNTPAQGSFSISGDSAIIVENKSSESAYGIYSSSTEAMVAQTAEITAANTQGPAVGVYGPATISGGKVTVTGGVADKTYALRGVFGNKTTVTDGEFTVLSPTDAAVATQCVISGGSFSGNVSDWAADGYTAQKGENGRYTLVKLDANNAVAQVGDNYYNSLSAAVAAAPADSTVMLLDGFPEKPELGKESGFSIPINRLKNPPDGFPVFGGLIFQFREPLIECHFSPRR